MIRFLAVFFAVAVVDVLWALYMGSVARKQAFWAATWSSLIILLGAFSVVQYTQDHWMLAPAMLGAFIGTHFTVSRK